MGGRACRWWDGTKGWLRRDCMCMWLFSFDGGVLSLSLCVFLFPTDPMETLPQRYYIAHTSYTTNLCSILPSVL